MEGSPKTSAKFQSAGLLQGVLDAFPGKVAVLDRQGDIVGVNRAWTEFARHGGKEDATDWTGRCYFEACREFGGLAAEDAPALKEGLAGVVEGREARFDRECRCDRAGQERWFRIRLHGVEAEGRRWAVVSHVDVTEARLTREGIRTQEDLLRENATRLRLATAASRVALWDWDLRVDELFLSPEWKQQLGYGDDEIESRFEEWEARLHPHDREEALKAVQDYVEGRRADYAIEFRLRHKDGSYRWIYTRADKLLDANGETVRIFGCHLDVTEHRRAAEHLRESEERFRNMMEQSPVSIQVHDLDGRLAETNSAYARLYALGEAALAGLHEKYNVLEDEQAEAMGLMAYIRKPFAGEEVVFPPYQYNGLDTLKTLDIDEPVSRVCWIQTNGFPLRNDHGEVVKAVFMSEDITERKRAEDKNDEYQQRLKALTSQLSIVEERERQRIATELHDEVGQNLASARLQIASAVKACTDPGLAGRLKELSATLLQATRDTRHLVYDLSSPALHELGLEEAVKELLEEHGETRHGLETRFVCDGCSCALGEDVRSLLFRNVRELLLNVVKHAGASRVTVRLGCRDEISRVVVDDDGCGFDADAESFRTSRDGGFGLFSIRERMINMGGGFEVVSQPGKGCRVVMTVPCREGAD